MSARRALLGLALAVALTGSGEKAASPRVVPAERLHFIPQSASFVSPSLGWAWGPARWPIAGGSEAGVLAKTEDGGLHWSGFVTPGLFYAGLGGAPGLSGVLFVSARRGYLFGSQLLVTDDGGTSWRRVPVPGTIVELEAADGNAYAAALDCVSAETCSTAHLYRVDAQGLVRIGPRNPISGWFSLVTRARSVYLLIPDRNRFGSKIWASHDQGRSWRTLSAPCQWTGADGGTLAAWSPSGLALACGSEPGAGSQAKMFYRSVDGGRSWRFVGKLPFGPGYLGSLAAADADTWVLGEARGGIEVTRDGGHVWAQAKFRSPASVEGWGDVRFIDRTHGVAVPWTLNGDVLAFTRDGGLSWREVKFRLETLSARSR